MHWLQWYVLIIDALITMICIDYSDALVTMIFIYYFDALVINDISLENQIRFSNFKKILELLNRIILGMPIWIHSRFSN